MDINLPAVQDVPRNASIVGETLGNGQMRERDMALDAFTGLAEYQHEKCNKLTAEHVFRS